MKLEEFKIRMQGKEYLVKYLSEEQEKETTIQGELIGIYTDNELIQMIHFYVGKMNKLLSIKEYPTGRTLFVTEKTPH